LSTISSSSFDSLGVFLLLPDCGVFTVEGLSVLVCGVPGVVFSGIGESLGSRLRLRGGTIGSSG